MTSLQGGQGIMSNEVLDVCCGGKMFYVGDTSNVLFIDERNEDIILCDERIYKVRPDVVADFQNLPLDDNSFNLVIFDPPHLLKIGENSYMAKKYGKLGQDWQTVIRNGFNECFRVLKSGGTLVFKWSEHDIKISDVLLLFHTKPLILDRGRGKNTVWCIFYKGGEL